MAGRTIYSSIWDEPWFHAYSQTGKLLFLYLTTSPNTNPAGLYVVLPQIIFTHTGIEPDALPAALSEISNRCLYDLESGAVWVKNFLRIQGRAPTFLKSALKSALNGPKIFLHDFLEHNRDLLSNLPAYPIDTLSIPYRQGRDSIAIGCLPDTDTDTEAIASSVLSSKAVIKDLFFAAILPAYEQRAPGRPFFPKSWGRVKIQAATEEVNTLAKVIGVDAAIEAMVERIEYKIGQGERIPGGPYFLPIWQEMAAGKAQEVPAELLEQRKREDAEKAKAAQEKAVKMIEIWKRDGTWKTLDAKLKRRYEKQARPSAS